MSGRMACRILMLVLIIWANQAAVALAAAQAHPLVNVPFSRQGTMLVVVEQQKPDTETPWQNQNLTHLSYTAALIEPGWLVVPASLVLHATHMVAKEDAGSLVHPLRVVQIDSEVGVAFLEPIYPEGLQGKPRLSLDSGIPWGRTAQLSYGTEEDPRAGTKLFFSHLTIQSPPGSYFPLVSYVMNAEDTTVRKGGVVTRAGELLGLALNQTKGQWVVIPSSVITRMREEIKSGSPYKGFGSLSLRTAAFSTKGLRAWLQVANSKEGVRITEVFATSPWYGKLLPNDVLLAVNNNPIDQEGLCLIDKQHKVPYEWIVQQHPLAMPFSVTVLRKGQILYSQALLEPHRSDHYLIPPESSQYLLVGGVLLQELSLEYLQSLGRSWETMVPEELLYQYQWKNQPSSRSLPRRLVVMRRVLTDAINQSFDFPTHAIVSKVNEGSAQSIQEIQRRLVESPVMRGGKKFVTLESGDRKMIFSYQDLAVARPRILQTYGLPPAISSF